MENFKKLIHPTNYRYRNSQKRTNPFRKNFIKIEYVDGRLSLSGVMGPKPSGNCHGSAGQCIDTICDLNDENCETVPVKPWTPLMLDKLQRIWEAYHLNDCSTYSDAMKEAGWDRLARKPILEISCVQTLEVLRAVNHIEERTKEELKTRGTTKVTEEERRLLNLPYHKKIYCYPEEEHQIPEGYKLDKSHGITKTTLGWVRPEAHPDGLLGRVFEPTGEKYGSKYYTLTIPEGVLQWLKNLPDSDVSCPWGSF